MTVKIKILLVEDDAIDQMAFKRFVRSTALPYTYTLATSVQAAGQALDSENFDLVIVDYMLGDGTAFDILTLVPEQTAIIFATGVGDEEIAVKAMKAGVDDYVVKDMERNYLKVLPLTIEHVMGRRRERQEVAQLRDAMIHTMVHDLRSPLGSIMTALQFMQLDAEEHLDEEQQQLLDIALRGADRLLNLVNAILDVSRLEDGKMPLEPGAVSLHTLVAETLTDMSPLAEEKALNLHNDVAETLPPVWADAQLIGRVVQNLIGNAIKFTPKTGDITITAQQKQDKVLLSVQDTGPGIPPDLRERLFQKFVTGTIKGRGSGLGLAFCKLVLEEHGETIWVESEVGQGTTFSFTLPVAQQDNSPT